MEELIVALHMHTIYSDGSGTHSELAQAGLKAGIDAIIITDHNILVEGMEGYVNKGKKRLLVLVGEEIHDQSLTIGKNHLLVFGHNRELSCFAAKPQQLINQAASVGALIFIAHPIEDALPRFGEGSFGWQDWDVSGYTGIELWNQMSEFKTRSTTLLQAVRNALFPNYMSVGPLERTLALWDDLLIKSQQKIVAVAGVDAHNLIKNAGPLTAHIYPYEFQFRSLNTHIFTPSALTGEINTDRQMVYSAFRQGHCFAAYDLPHPTRGFHFTANNNDGEFIMGDEVTAVTGLTLQVRPPIRSHIRLLRNGKVIKEHTDREVLTYLTKEPGIYRAEVYIDYLGKHRGWIFSNPIYAR